MIKKTKLRSPKLLTLSRQFVFSQVESWLPRGIGSTDVDAAVERNGQFLWFEFKCSVLPPDLKRGQAIYWQQQIKAMRGNGHMLLCSHPDLLGRDLADPSLAVDTIRIMYFDPVRESAEMTQVIPVSTPVMQWLLARWVEWTRDKTKTEFQDYVAHHAVAH